MNHDTTREGTVAGMTLDSIIGQLVEIIKEARKMTLDEAIKHCEEVANKCDVDTDWGMGNHFIDRSGVVDVIECGKEHRQLAEWLKELKDRRAKDENRKNTC